MEFHMGQMEEITNFLKPAQDYRGQKQTDFVNSTNYSYIHASLDVRLS